MPRRARKKQVRTLCTALQDLLEDRDPLLDPDERWNARNGLLAPPLKLQLSLQLIAPTLGSYQGFRFFYGASNVEYTITVIDTETGVRV